MGKKKKTIEELVEEVILPEDERRFDIPENWFWTRIGALTDVIGGGTPKSTKEEYYENGTISWITPADLSGYQDMYIQKGKRNITELGLKESSAKVLPAHTVLLSSRAPIGYVAIASKELCTNQGFKSFVPSNAFYPKYLYWYLKFSKAYLESIASGSTFKELSAAKCKEIVLPLPPKNEQKRIAEKVERLLGKIDEAKQLIEEAKESFELRRAAILDKAFRGELTVNWRVGNSDLECAEQLIESIKLDKERVYEENCKRAEKEGTRKPRKAKVKIEKSDFEHLYEDLPKSWKIAYFDEITEAKENAIKAGPFGSALKKVFYTPSGYKIYGQEQVIKGDSSYGDYYVNEEKYKELESCAITKGDLLISLVGTIGKTLVIPEEHEQGIINPRLIKISLHEKVNPYFIATYFESYLAKKIMSEGSHGGTMQILNMSILKKLPIPLPPKKEQDKILETVNNLLDTERISKKLIGIESHLNTIKQSILSKAFQGELGTNDPSEENAIKLLKEVLQEQVK